MKFTKKTVRSIIRFFILTIMGIAMFILSVGPAYSFRGYFAIGGEYILLILPHIIFYFVYPVVKDMLEDIKDLL